MSVYNRSSNQVTNTCPDGIYSTNCITYQGPPLPCLNISTGDTLTCLQEKIVNSICQLVTETDASNILIPDCFQVAFVNQDTTVLSFLQFLLDQACIQQKETNVINSTLANFNPPITVDYRCCSDNPCVTTGTVTLTQSLENIIACLCTQKSNIDSLTGQVDTLTNSTIPALNLQISQISITLAQLVTSNASIVAKTSCLPNC